jgi:hypothetical protein
VLDVWDAQFWMQIPLPPAVVSSRLNTAGVDCIDRLIELLEGAVVLPRHWRWCAITSTALSSIKIVQLPVSPRYVSELAVLGCR